jgi:5-methyltetrahydrofolate--homocysteine methyltransferase
MAKVNLIDKIKKGVFILDGAMGTQLIARGVKPDKCPDSLNVESPDVIFDIHRAYINSGSDAVLTNTFGSSEIALARHKLADKLEQINTAAANTARSAAGPDRYVIGDIGPAGDFLEPLGSLKPKDLENSFARQAKALAQANVDGIIIETMTSLDEAAIAVKALKSVCDLPVFVSFAYDAAKNGFKTMMGLGPADALEKMLALKVDAVGFNCGSLTIEQYVALAGIHANAAAAKITLLAEPNAGKPQIVDGRTVYNLSPQRFAQAVATIHSAGVNIIGGCCGTGPEHIKAAAQILRSA